jgi:hypothetical protein
MDTKKAIKDLAWDGISVNDNGNSFSIKYGENKHVFGLSLRVGREYSLPEFEEFCSKYKYRKARDLTIKEKKKQNEKDGIAIPFFLEEL